MSGMGLDHKRGSGKTVGFDIEDVLPSLPANAEYMGSSSQAMGQVVRPTIPPEKLRLLKHSPTVQGLSGLSGLPVGPAGQPAMSLSGLKPEEAIVYAKKLEGAVGATTMASFILGIVIGMQVQKAKTILWATLAAGTLLTGMSAGQLSVSKTLTKLMK